MKTQTTILVCEKSEKSEMRRFRELLSSRQASLFTRIRLIRREDSTGEAANSLRLACQQHLLIEEGSVLEQPFGELVAALLVRRGRHQQPPRKTLHENKSQVCELLYGRVHMMRIEKCTVVYDCM